MFDRLARAAGDRPSRSCLSLTGVDVIDLGRPSRSGGWLQSWNEAQRLWDECAGILRAQVSEPVWLTSFEAARPVSFDGALLTLAVPSFLAKERIEGRYLSLVRDALAEIGAADVALTLEIAPSEPPSRPWTLSVAQPAAPISPVRPVSSEARDATGARHPTLGTPSTPS